MKGLSSAWRVLMRRAVYYSISHGTSFDLSTDLSQKLPPCAVISWLSGVARIKIGRQLVSLSLLPFIPMATGSSAVLMWQPLTSLWPLTGNDPANKRGSESRALQAGSQQAVLRLWHLVFCPNTGIQPLRSRLEFFSLYVLTNPISFHCSLSGLRLRWSDGIQH